MTEAGSTSSNDAHVDEVADGSPAGDVTDANVSSVTPSSDGALSDGPLPDGALADGALADGALADGTLGDSAIADGAVADAGPHSTDASFDGADAPGQQADGAMTSNDAAIGSARVCVATSPCASGQSLCNGVCVSSSDPAFGCGSCGTCAPYNAQPGCGQNGACVIVGCQPGFADTNGDPTDGCETDFSSPTSCTSSLLVCTGATNLCSPTGCVAQCSPPLTQCGYRCVNLTQSTGNCGQCSNTCDSPSGGFATCSSSGICGAPTCFGGRVACNGGCSDLLTDGRNCGACGNACPGVTNAAGTCVNGTCGALCQPGWTHCESACVVTGTDPQNCGGCGKVCGASDACVSGECVPATSLWLATGLSSPNGIVTDTESVYFTDPGTGTVNAVAKTGGSVLVLATGQSKPESIAVDDTYVYWGNNLGGAVLRTLKSGGDTAHIVASVSSTRQLVVDSTYIYAIDGNFILQRAPKSEGSTAAPFATTYGGIEDIAINGNNLYFAGSYTIISEPISYPIYQLNLATHVATMLGTVQDIDALATAGNIVGASAIFPSGITWFDVANTQPGQLISFYNSNPPSVMAAANCGFVWYVSAGEAIPLGLRLSTLGSSIPVPIYALGVPNRMVVDNDIVYWTDTSGAIGKIALP